MRIKHNEQLINDIKECFFYEKRFKKKEIAPRAHESSEVRNFFAGKTNAEITYADLKAEAHREVGFYHLSSYIYMYPEACAYFLGLYMVLALSEDIKDPCIENVNIDIMSNLIGFLQFDYPKTSEYDKLRERDKVIKSCMTKQQKKVICNFIKYVEEFYYYELLDTDKAVLQWCY